jgi:hypothetical protein
LISNWKIIGRTIEQSSPALYGKLTIYLEIASPEEAIGNQSATNDHEIL